MLTMLGDLSPWGVVWVDPFLWALLSFLSLLVFLL